MNKKKKRYTGERGPIFSFVLFCLRAIFKKPVILNLNEEPLEDGAIYISNHEGAAGPIKHLLYFHKRFVFWGAHEMTENLKAVFYYESDVFFHQKKGWPLWFARIFSFITCPLMWAFYRGLPLIPTYPDARFVKTLRISRDCLKDDINLVIFPENSDQGYFEVLTAYRTGFIHFAKFYRRSTGNDVSIYPMYYYKKENTLIIGKRMSLSALLLDNPPEDALAEGFKNLTNELKTSFDQGTLFSDPPELVLRTLPDPILPVSPKALSEEAPAAEAVAPAEETPAAEAVAPAEEAPAEETPAEEAPAAEAVAPAEETPAAEAVAPAEVPEELPAE